MDKLFRISVTALFGAAIFAFWMWLYPQALSYHEQYQLFLFTWDYLAQRLSVSGGLADWLSEFLVQFFFLRWSGALVLAIVAICLQLAVWHASRSVRPDGSRFLYALSFVPSLLIIIYMGNTEVLVSFPVALTLSVALCPLFARAGWHTLWLIPLAWWLLGPVALVPVLFAVLLGRRPLHWALLIYTSIVVYALYRLFLSQYTPRDVLFGINYGRLREMLPALQVIIPVVTLLCIFACAVPVRLRQMALAEGALLFLLAAGTLLGVKASYDRDTYEMIAYDDLIRHGKYKEVIERAEHYQPHSPISSCSVNFCLFMEGQLSRRLTEFYQCGTGGLVLPSIRDSFSDLTSAEIFFMMGMPNTALQYYFDCMESIQNCRLSGRFLSRMADCNLINGWWGSADKYLDILSKSLFYRKDALRRKKMVGSDQAVSADPVYAYVRAVRFKEDFISSYEALDLMMALLYNQDNNNFMAGEYYSVWQRLKKKEGGAQ